MSRVFLLQQPRPRAPMMDLTSALVYGKLEPVFESTEQPSLAVVPSIRKARRILQAYGPEDYLLWCGGDPIGLSICSILAAEANQGDLRFLRWDRMRDVNTGERLRAVGQYYPVNVTMRERFR